MDVNAIISLIMSQCPLNGRGRCGGFGLEWARQHRAVSMPSERAGTLRVVGSPP